MKSPFEIVPFIWPEDQLGVLEPHPIPYIAKGQRVFSIYNKPTGQFFRWAYPSLVIAQQVANNLASAGNISPKHWGTIPTSVVIPKIYANLPGIRPAPTPAPKADPEIIFTNH